MAVKFIASISRWIGLAADTKPVAASASVPVGSTFYEYDTGVTYITYDGTNWAVGGDGADMAEAVVSTTSAVMSNALTIFTVAGGPIEIITLVSFNSTQNNATASTLQYSTDPTVGAATTISGASATLANAAAGTFINITGTLANAPVITTNGTAISQAGRIVVPAGIITLVIGVGSTTGKWQHNLRYVPLDRGVTVTAAF